MKPGSCEQALKAIWMVLDIVPDSWLWAVRNKLMEMLQLIREGNVFVAINFFSLCKVFIFDVW